MNTSTRLVFKLLPDREKIERILSILKPFKRQFDGEVGIGIDANWAEPAIWSRDEDIQATD